MNTKLFKTILAMDSYNRGYNQSIALSNAPDSIDQILGHAVIIRESDIDSSSDGVKKGFYALAYEIRDNNGNVTDNVISYRGTDDPLGLVSGSDILEGWVIGAGIVSDNQAELAIKFYKEVAKTIDGPDADFQTVNISLTGHSLGGGLASYIAALYGRETDSYDAMPFTLAVGQTVFRTTHYNAAWTDSEGVYHEGQIDYGTLQQYQVDPDVTVHTSGLIDPYLKQLANITTTGHSLGGGLAGLLGANDNLQLRKAA